MEEWGQLDVKPHTGGRGTHVVRNHQNTRKGFVPMDNCCSINIATGTSSRIQRPMEITETTLQSAKKHTQDDLPCG